MPIGQKMKGHFSFWIFLISLYGTFAMAAPYNSIHTNIFRSLVPKIAGEDKTLPFFEVCLRHHLSGQCLSDRPRFFSCEDPDINKYISCISDPKLNERISSAYDRMYKAGKAEVIRIQKDKKITPAQKSIMLEKMNESLKTFEALSKDEKAKLKQIDGILAKSNRFEVTKLLSSPEFRQKVNEICKSKAGSCLSVKEYRDQGKKLIEKFSQDFSKLDAQLKDEQGQGLDDILSSEMAIINKCMAENRNDSPSSFCKSFTPDPVVMKAVGEEINKGICNHLSTRGLDIKTRTRLSVICAQYYHYFLGKAKADQEDEESKKNSAMARNQNGTEKKGIEEGKSHGQTNTKEGVYSDYFSRHLKENKYECDKIDPEVDVNCEDPSQSQLLGQVRDLAKSAEEAGKKCSGELDSFQKKQLDAAGYLLETQFRAYVDRLNVNKAIAPQKYQKLLEDFVSSCEAPKRKVEDTCDQENNLRKHTHEYLKDLAAQALIERQKQGFNKELSDAYVQDTVKAAQDLKALDESMKDLLSNFPAPKGGLGEVWPDLFPCQSVVALVDGVMKSWDSTQYNSRCPSLEGAQRAEIPKEQELFYQKYKAVELGLVEGKTLKDFPDKQVNFYLKLKKDKKFNNDLDGLASGGKIHQDKKNKSMFMGQSSSNGRVIVVPGILTGLEGRELECKKKADQVRNLINMKASLLANYPQLADKTFSDGARPSREWNFWDKNCRGQSRYQNICRSQNDCKTTIRPGCEKTPNDWSKQETPRELYERLGPDENKYGEKIAKHLSQEPEIEMDSLKESATNICKDPLDAGAYVIQNDRLYTLYASCALQNIQNGERRDPQDVDGYQFWKAINQSSQSKAKCKERSARSVDRCLIVKHLNSNFMDVASKKAAQVAPPVMQALDVVSCAAMFTGVGGALYTGIKTGAQAGISAGMKAGGKFLGQSLAASVQSVATPLGGGLSAAGMGFALNNVVVTEKEYQRVKDLFASGLASAQELEGARQNFEQAELAKNLQAMILGTFVPAGKGKAPKVSPRMGVRKQLLSGERQGQRTPATKSLTSHEYESKISLTILPEEKNVHDLVIFRRIDENNQVFARIGKCCKGLYKQDAEALVEKLKQSVKSSEGSPYFIGDISRPHSEKFFAKKNPDYNYTPPKKLLEIDFSKEFPGLDELSLKSFEMDVRGKLTEKSKLEAIDYIKQNFPDADQYDISFLAQGGFNAVFKACRKTTRDCKVIKLPGFDESAVLAVKDQLSRIKRMDLKLALLKKKLSEKNISAERQDKLERDHDFLVQQRTDAFVHLKNDRMQMQEALESYKMDLGLTAWADDLLSPGKSPKLGNEEFISHGAIDRNPNLLRKGIVVQEYYGLDNPSNMAKYRKELERMADNPDTPPADREIAKYFGNLEDKTADVRFIKGFYDFCERSVTAVIKAYCKDVRLKNRLPAYDKFKSMLSGTLQFYEDTHEVVGLSVKNHFGIDRRNPVGFNAIQGQQASSYVGFDPLSGKNIFFNKSDGKIVLPDR